jgi:3-(3-hydroxy-phenyl)propionate hydroxylase
MTSPTRYDVIIVGCGPVGVVAAHLLGSYGIATLVVERDLEPYELPRAIHLDHEVMRIFQSVGLADRLLPQLSIPAGSMHFGADRGVIRQFQKMVKTDRLGWASDYFFYQPDLERTLRASLAERPSVTILKGHEVQRPERGPPQLGHWPRRSRIRRALDRGRYVGRGARKNA